MRYPGFLMLLALLGFEILCMGHPSVGYGSEDLISLSLQDSVRFALSHTPEVRSAQKTHRVSELQYTNSWAKLLPSLDLWTQNGFQNNLPDPDFLSAPSENPTGPWSSRLGLSLKQNLYDNGESLIQMSIADLNQELARVNQLKTRDSVILQVTQEFYGFSESSALLEVMHQQKASLEKEHKILAELYLHGLRPRVDVVRLQSQLKKTEVELISAKNRIELAVAQLKRLIGVPPEKIRQYQFLPVSLPEQKVVVREVTLVPPVIEDTYAYKSSKIQRQINEKNVLFSRRNYWPQLNFSAGVTYGHLNYLKPTEPLRDREGLNWHVLLTLDFNFLDWGIRKRNLVIADYEREIQDNALDQSLLDVQSEIEQLKTNLSRSAESYQVGFELLKLENESYQRIEIDFQAGRAAYLDLVTSISGVLEAKNQFISSYFDLMQNRAQYYYLKGSIYENWPQF